ncbi:hypothetical protein FBU30_000234 [Linnemannia zychae]|nr:hypothetical protein FBU30_000234 [Linnemannia zychae]
MDPNHINSNGQHFSPAGEAVHYNSSTREYPNQAPFDASSVAPAAYSNSSSNYYTPNPFQFSDNTQDDSHDHYPSSSEPLRLNDVNNSRDPAINTANNDRHDDLENTSPAHLVSITPPGKILVLQTLTTLSTIVFTVLPVVIKAGSDASWGNWYTWRDAVRFIEPFVSGLFHSWFFYSSDLMRRWNHKNNSEQGNHRSSATSGSWREAALEDDKQHTQQSNTKSYSSSSTTRIPWKQTVWFKATLANAFTFFLIVYVTGASIHTAAAFFKNIIELFLEQYSQGIGLSTHPLTNGDGQLSMTLASQLKEGYLLIQDTWEHNISHYLYAFGALGMSWCEMIAYSGQILPVGVNLARVNQVSSSSQLGVRSKKSSKRLVFLWILAGVLYGAIVAGVACQYPKGLYVGLAYIGVLFLVLVIYIITRPTRGLFTLGRHYILQTYLIGTIVATVAIVIYLAINHFEFLTSNDKSHLASITRP